MKKGIITSIAIALALITSGCANYLMTDSQYPGADHSHLHDKVNTTGKTDDRYRDREMDSVRRHLAEHDKNIKSHMMAHQKKVHHKHTIQ